jgi:hypothetical protein
MYRKAHIKFITLNENLIFMRDAYSIIGKEVYYKEKHWTVKDFFYVPNNVNIFVGLTSGGVTLNVTLDDVMSLLVQ